MKIKSSISHFIGSHRFLSRKLRAFQPEISPITISHDFELYLDPKDLYGPSYNVMYDKAAAFYRYEEELKADVVQYLKRGGVFFDVGANIGLISFFVKKFYPESAIFAFEPGRVVSHCLKKTIEANHISNVTVITKGVADKSGVAEFFIDPKSTGGSSIIKHHAGSVKNHVERIELISLDEFVAQAGVIPSLVKVDVEGVEGQVIIGAKKLIEQHRPVFIIETNNKKMLENLDLWKTIFKGYCFRPVGKKEFYSLDQLEKVGSDYVAKNVAGTDYLFVPQEQL